jgi:hypothetical protein
MTTLTREQLSELLHNGECVVEFTKVDGTVRSMPCTLSEALIPPPPVHVTNTDNPIDFPAPKKEKKVNPDVLNVWCLDKKEWRSFRIANVISAKAKDDNTSVQST